MTTLVCAKGHPGQPGQTFCRRCGSPMELRCPSGHHAPLDALFCRRCGRPLDAQVGTDVDGAISESALESPAEALTAAGSTGPSEGEEPAPDETTLTELPSFAETLPTKNREFTGQPETATIAAKPQVGSKADGAETDLSPPPTQRRSASIPLLLVLAAALLVAGGVSAAVVLSLGSRGSGRISGPTARTTTGTGSRPRPSPEVTGSPTSQVTIPPEEAAARDLSAMLEQSVQDRSAVLGCHELPAATGTPRAAPAAGQWCHRIGVGAESVGDGGGQ